jgi:hypothetical protein
MFSLASTYCAEIGRSKIPADEATASATVGHLARSKSSRWGILRLRLRVEDASPRVQEHKWVEPVRTDQRRDPRARAGCQAWPALRGSSIELVIIQSPAINAVAPLGDRTGECPAQVNLTLASY